MTPTRKIAEGVMFFSSNTLILTALGFLTNVILVRTLDLDDYGLYILLLSVYSIMCLFLDFGLAGLITTETARAIGEGNREKAKDILESYKRLVIKCSTIVFVLVLIGFYLAADAGGGPLFEAVRNCALPLSLFLILTGVMTIFQTVFYAHSSFKDYVSMNVVQDAVVFLLIFAAASMGWSVGAYGAIVAYVAATITALILSLPSYMKTMGKYAAVKGGGGEFRGILRE